MHRILSFLPALIIALCYLIFLGYRSDYAGHYMAGFGGTLFAIMAFAETPREQGQGCPMSNGLLIIIVFLCCVAFGTALEATIFRLAKFDEIDFCNQNIGAVIAALLSLAVLPESGADRSVITRCRAAATLFLIAGFFYAFA